MAATAWPQVAAAASVVRCASCTLRTRTAASPPTPPPSVSASSDDPCIIHALVHPAAAMVWLRAVQLLLVIAVATSAAAAAGEWAPVGAGRSIERHHNTLTSWSSSRWRAGPSSTMVVRSPPSHAHMLLNYYCNMYTK